MSNVRNISVSSWQEFLDLINKIFQDDENISNSGYRSPLLFRGQKDSGWSLTSTLDRYVERVKSKESPMTVDHYYQIISACLPAFASYTGLRYMIPQPDSSEYSDHFKHSLSTLPAYDFMVHLRHHGFPSPLLDWSRSPYVAAFFAFNEVGYYGTVSVYCFQAVVGLGKSGWANAPRINDHGPYVITHERHYRQQAEYTTCVLKRENNWYFVPHETAKFEEEQDVLYKIDIPAAERKKAMRQLDQMNINAFSLFGSHEGLADMLAYREIEKDL